MKMEIKEQFKLDVQFKKYLERVYPQGWGNMPPVQYSELKRAFYGAAGQMLILLKDDLAELEEMAAIITLKDMLDQVGEFFKKECN